MGHSPKNLMAHRTGTRTSRGVGARARLVRPVPCDLLVANFGDGHANVFRQAHDGALTGAHGRPLVLDGEWGVAFGNGAGAGSKDAFGSVSAR
jgi:hypothetical protein